MMRFSLHSFHGRCEDYFLQDNNPRRQLCPSCPGGGATTDTFVYTGNRNLNYPGDGYNTWSTKTAQSLPDHSQIVVYCNYAGLPTLRVNVDPLGNMLATLYRYQADGQVMWGGRRSNDFGRHMRERHLLSACRWIPRRLTVRARRAAVLCDIRVRGGRGGAGEIREH